MKGLRRFWLTFEDVELPAGAGYGVGVTANSSEEALAMVRDAVFGGEPPPVANLIEDVDVSTLDEGHVLPNMDPPVERGIWFPRGYR